MYVFNVYCNITIEFVLVRSKQKNLQCHQFNSNLLEGVVWLIIKVLLFASVTKRLLKTKIAEYVISVVKTLCCFTTYFNKFEIN